MTCNHVNEYGKSRTHNGCTHKHGTRQMPQWCSYCHLCTKGTSLPDPVICYLCGKPFRYCPDDHGWWRCFPRWFRRFRRCTS